jgi:alcohol dehydrogenase
VVLTSNRLAFTLPRLERVISGRGTLDALPVELDRYGVRRVVIVTGVTLGASPLVDRVRSLLAARCVAAFTGARQHVPASTVRALRTLMSESAADAIVSVGGGSPIDTAKAVVHGLLHARDRATIPIHIAVPTTLSAGEFTDVAGITDDDTRIKHAVYDTSLAPRTVIADPEVTVRTPSWLWAASGVRALDHAVETLYAKRRHPISEPLAERAIGMLTEHLPFSLNDDGDARLHHRGVCQMASWLAVFGVTNAGFGLSHVLGHQIGPRWCVPHGVTSAIVLPHVMRFMAAVAPERFGPIGRGLNVPVDSARPAAGASACADRVADVIGGLGLPQRLRDVSVPRDELSGVAAVVAGLMDGGAVVEHPVGPDDLVRILEAAY